MAEWWEEYEVVTPRAAPRPKTLKERDIEAGIGQSGASAESSAASAARSNTLLPADLRKAEADAAKAEADAAKAATETATTTKKAETGDADAVLAITNVLDKLDSIGLDANDNGGWFETGMSGGLARDYGPKGTPAYDLAADIETIDANTAFAALQKMRESSPTGGALGNVTERELDLLKSSVSNLDPNTSHGTFLKNAGISKRYYLDMLRRLDPDKAAEYEKRGFGEDEYGPYLMTPADDGTQTKNYFLADEDDSGGAAGATDGGPSGGGSGGGGSGPAPKPDPGYDMAGFLRRFGEGTGSMVEAAGSIPGMVLDPLMTTGFRAAGYPNYTYNTGEVLREAIGLPDNSEQTNDTLIKGGALGMTGAGLARGAASLAQPGALQGALNVFGAQPGRDALGGLAAAGAGEIARRNDVGPLGQAGASIVGGLAGHGIGGMASGMATPKVATPIAEAAQRQMVDIIPADTGSTTARLATAATRASPFSAAPVVEAAKKTQNQLRDAAGRAARSEGAVPTTDVAGEWLQQAGKRYAAKTQDIGNTMYQRAFKAAGDVKVPAATAVGKIDDMLKQLRAAPETNAGAIRDLTKLRSDLRRGLTAEQMHGLRSEISQGVYDGALRSGTDKGRMKAIRGALSEDMLGFFDKNFMPAISNGIRKADKYWEGRVEQIDEVLQPILGKEGQKGGEQVVQAVETMARGGQGGNKRLSRLMANMTGEEQGQIRSTLIDRLGRATPGEQTAEGNAFSASTFLSNWNKMTPQAKGTLFKDGDLRKNLDDIAKLSEGTKGSQKMQNHSNTSGAMQGSAALQIGWAVGHLPSYLAGVGGQFLTGQLMASPRFAKWLARAPAATKPEAQRKMLDQLGVIATREPALRQDAMALQQHLQQSLQRSPGAINAEEEGN